MSWLESSLNRKFIAGTAVGLLVSLAVFLALFAGQYRAEVKRARTDTATQVNRLLQTSLENAMLKRDLEGLKTIVQRLGSQRGVLGVMITNPAGEVRFSSKPSLLGGHIPPELDKGRDPDTRFLEDDAGRRILRSRNPVHNKATCQECHGSMEEKPVNGILYVDYDAAPIRARARDTTLLLMGSGALIVVINLLGGWWFIRRFVIRPVGLLSVGAERIARGELDARVSLTGRDELARLGTVFDHMASRLHAKMQELEESRHFLQQLVDAIPDGVRIIDKDFRVILANNTYRRQLGWRAGEEPPSMCYAATHNRDSPCPSTLMLCPLKEVNRTRSPLRVVHRHQKAGGEEYDVEIYAVPMEVTKNGLPQTLVVESIRDLEQEVKFSHEQKLSELGRLAAGVAHEIHNPLASIRLALNAAEQANDAEHPAPAQIAGFLALVDNEIEKCIEVTERLLKLSMAAPAEAELVTVDRAVGDTLNLLHWEAESRSVKICLDVRDAPLRILATDSELRMVTLNLAQNALHAMPRGGELRVSCRRNGSHVEVLFEDTGVGIQAEDREHIFEPFFSRRADGVNGTGLGLPISKAIVKSHDGSIEVDSEPGRGSRFLIVFPDADSQSGA